MSNPNGSARSICLRCWRSTSPVVFAPADYAELLGLYLGDGHITLLARSSTATANARREVSARRRRSRGLDRSRRAGEQGRPAVPARRTDGDAPCYHRHWTCLFPQHGPGKKHDRAIELEPWQRALVAEARSLLLRGLIRSDGCVFINRTGRYEYESYDFANLSRGHPRALRRDLRAGRCRLPCVQEVRADLSPGERRADARARRSKAMSLTLSCTPSAAVAELGRRAAFRSPWG